MSTRRPPLVAFACMLALVACAGTGATAALAQGATTATVATAPANDTLAGAQAVRSFPAAIDGTVVGATIEPNERGSQCAGPTNNSVWYTVRLPAAHRVALQLAASGALDASIDVYHAVRSQLEPVDCQRTDSKGDASLSFKASKNGLYDIRVAALEGSQLDPFTLEVFLPTPAVNPPGAALPGGGVSGQVDRIQNINAAYSFTMHAGVSYLINLADRTEGACVSGALFAPGTSSFGDNEEEQEQQPASALLDIRCGGYRLFTPGPGQGGLYSFEVTPDLAHRGVQRFHLQVAVAGAAETAPGLELGNYGVVHGQLNGNGVRVLRLYRMQITSHSNLTLKLDVPQSAEFKLQLRNQNGNVIECDCEGGGPQTLEHQLQPGTYYAVVSARGGSSGQFTLTRESRTITATAISFSSGKASPEQALDIDVKVTPAESGPAVVVIERFDPVFGWQFYREEHALVSGGLATIPFIPPADGLWRAKANYEGSRTASPSAVGHTYLLVA